MKNIFYNRIYYIIKICKSVIYNLVLVYLRPGNIFDITGGKYQAHAYRARTFLGFLDKSFLH